jgi:hypothetical protein
LQGADELRWYHGYYMYFPSSEFISEGVFYFVQKRGLKMAIKIVLLIVFFSVMIGVGLYCRRNVTDVNGFVLGGRSVGP